MVQDAPEHGLVGVRPCPEAMFGSKTGAVAIGSNTATVATLQQSEVYYSCRTATYEWSAGLRISKSRYFFAKSPVLVSV